MGDKWYNEPNCDWMDEYREQKKAQAKRVRSICSTLIGISLFMAVGLVGGAEQGEISIAQFMVYEIITIATLLISIRVIAGMEDK